MATPMESSPEILELMDTLGASSFGVLEAPPFTPPDAL